MKRKITELEQKLLDKGFRLLKKNYAGKYSQKTDSYEYRNVYVGLCEVNFLGFVLLDYKREKILEYGIIPVSETLLILKPKDLEYYRHAMEILEKDVK